MKEIYKEMLRILEESDRAHTLTGVLFYHPMVESFGGLCLLRSRLYRSVLSKSLIPHYIDMREDAEIYLKAPIQVIGSYWFTNVKKDFNKAKQERIDFLKWAIKHRENEKDNK